MKKIKVVAMILAVLTMLFVLGRIGWYEGHYYKDGTILSVKGTTVSVIDEDDNIWEFYGTGYTEGTQVRLTIDNNHTDLEIYDDSIDNITIIK